MRGCACSASPMREAAPRSTGGWGASLPADLEVCPVQIPGRESRLREQPFNHARAAWSRTSPTRLRPTWTCRSSSSATAWAAMIGFELARELRRRGEPLPLHLFVSGRRRAGPAGPRGADPRPARSRSSSSQAAGAQRHAGGGAPARRADEAADFPSCAPTSRSTRPTPRRRRSRFEFGHLRLRRPGRRGRHPRGHGGLAASTRTGRFRMRMLPGDHFFINTRSGKDLVLESVARDLAETAPPRHFPHRLVTASRPAPPRPASTLGPGEIHVWSVRLDPPRGAASTRLERLPLRRRAGAGRPLPLRPAPPAVRGGPRRPAHPARRLHGQPAGGGALQLRPARQAVPGRRPRRPGPAVQPLQLRRAGPGGVRPRPRDRGGRRVPEADAGLRADLRALLLARASGRCCGASRGPRKEEAFFNCWTRKEAYLKAVGEGLAAPLDSFDVTLALGEPPRMLTLKGDAERAARWFFHHLRPAESYIGAIAIEGGTWEGVDGEPWAFSP